MSEVNTAEQAMLAACRAEAEAKARLDTAAARVDAARKALGTAQGEHAAAQRSREAAFAAYMQALLTPS